MVFVSFTLDAALRNHEHRDICTHLNYNNAAELSDDDLAAPCSTPEVIAPGGWCADGFRFAGLKSETGG